MSWFALRRKLGSLTVGNVVLGRKMLVKTALGNLTLVALLLVFAVGCGSSAPTPPSVKPSDQPTPSAGSTQPYSAHVAFAGGGWRAHSGHSGWTLALLEDGSKTLDDVFTNVDTISSNSGGSWFSTMLVYSDSFVDAIQANDAAQTWGDEGPKAPGWLGQQQYLFDQAKDCQVLEDEEFLACVFDKYTGSIDNATYWYKVIEDLVFKNNPISGPLSGTRQGWAADKPLLLASTMLTAEAVLGDRGLDQQYYQACISPSTPDLNGDKGASCSGAGDDPPEVTPVTFSSLPGGSKLTAPPFFSALGPGRSGSLFNLGYTEDSSFFSPPTQMTTVGNPLASDQTPVVTAAAASSAAAGFGASYAVTGDWEVSYAASDEALNFQLAGGLKHVVADGMSVKDLAKGKIVQIADGGAVDNSAVAQLVGFLQQNQQADGFQIVAFDNVQETYPAGGGTGGSGQSPTVGIDIANLFGEGLWKGDQICSGPNGTGYCVTAPSLRIFDPAALTTPSQATWSAAASDNSPPSVIHELIYTKYAVQTVDNPTFGITKGTTGTLHAFTCVWTGAATAPENKTKDGDFDAYDAMFDFIQTGLKVSDGSGKTGLEYLQEALGLTP